MPRAHTEPSTDEIRIGISACLLGKPVRYDGGHKRDSFVNDVLGRFVTFVDVCPEVETGMGTPRETIRLVRATSGIRLMAPGSGTDHTASMTRYARGRVQELRRLDLHGYILKKDSPSCGMERVRVYDGTRTERNGQGMFAAALIAALPNLPVEEEGRLNDAALRENFVERVFAYRRLRDLFARRWTLAGLVRFHTAEKLLLLAHDPAGYRELGRAVAGAKGRDRTELAGRYESTFMQSMRKLATVRKNANVLQHMLGYFRRAASESERRELAAIIDDYRAGLIPLIVPIALFRHHVRRHDVTYLQGQTYLEPHPKELMLRNHV